MTSNGDFFQPRRCETTQISEQRFDTSTNAVVQVHATGLLDTTSPGEIHGTLSASLLDSAGVILAHRDGMGVWAANQANIATPSVSGLLAQGDRAGYIAPGSYTVRLSLRVHSMQCDGARNHYFSGGFDVVVLQAS